MVRGVLMVAGIALISACASAPTPSQQLLGKWSCSAKAEGLAVAGDFEYLAGGATKANAKMDVNAGPAPMSMTGVIDASWEFLEDGKLKETITGMKVETANMGGQPAPASVVASMIQPMVNQMVVGQASTSSVVFSGGTMTTTDEDGVVTTCKR